MKDLSPGVSLLVGLIAVWGCIQGIHITLKKCFSSSYTSLLYRRGITLSPGQIKLYTTALTGPLERMAQRCRRSWLSAWFTCAVLFGWIAMIASVALLVVNLVQLLSSLYAPLPSASHAPTRSQTPAPVLTPVIPGINVPTNHLVYYFVALAISGALHEAGHAIAAIIERVSVNGFGAFVFLIYPGCFVNIDDEALCSLSPLRQLRVYCAGVWHNFTLVLAALLGAVCVTWIAWPLFAHNTGALTVVAVSSDSALVHLIEPGDRILTLNERCTLSLHGDWQSCLDQVRTAPPDSKDGFCMSTSTLSQWNTGLKPWKDANGLWDCCPLNEHDNEASKLCFSFADNALESLDPNAFACLPVRKSIVNKTRCSSRFDCHSSDDVCIYPQISAFPEKLLTIEIADKPAVIYLGDPYNLLHALHLSEYSPRLPYLSAQWPVRWELLCRYTLSLSLALAILNMLPTYYFDGQWAFAATVDLLWGATLSKARRESLCNTVHVGCAALFLLNVAAMFLSMPV